MIMQLWPATVPDDQSRWLYISLASMLTTVFGFLAWKWLGFIMAAFWACLVLWDLVIGPMVVRNWNDENLNPDDEFDAAFGRFMDADTDKLRNELATVKAELEKLKRGTTGSGGSGNITDLINTYKDE